MFGELGDMVLRTALVPPNPTIWLAGRIAGGVHGSSHRASRYCHVHPNNPSEQYIYCDGTARPIRLRRRNLIPHSHLVFGRVDFYNSRD
jgi:hypothetical protein